MFDINYRLVPDHRFPAGVADARCLAGRIHEQAAIWRIDPKRGAYLGRFAGGHMALLLAYSAGDARLASACAAHEPVARAVVAIDPAVDLRYAYDHPIVPDVVDGPASLRAFLGGSPTEVGAAYDLASPLSWVQSMQTSTLLIHGEMDRLVAPRHSRVLAEAMTRATAPVEVIFIPLAEHGYDHRSGGLADQWTRSYKLAVARLPL